MKKNSFKYVLIGGVLLIWGTIIYKIITSLGRETESPVVTPLEVTSRVNNADTFSLLLNYEDPFLVIEEDMPVDTIQNNEASKITEPSSVISSNPNFSTVQPKPDFIKYTGYIYNPAKKKQIAMVTIREECFAMEENEEKNDVLLKKISKATITIRYKGAKFTIAKSY
jgi:hypothetical protein